MELGSAVWGGDGLQDLSLLKLGGYQGEVGGHSCCLFSHEQKSSKLAQTSFVSLLFFFFFKAEYGCLYPTIKPNRNKNIRELFPPSGPLSSQMS